MPVRIAFAACSKFNFDPKQEVWEEIAQHEPQHLMLLGDQIYMDFLGDADDPTTGFIGYGNGKPRDIPIGVFETQMRLRYEQQFGVPSFRKLVHDILRDGGQVEMVWDDHDFGFNNALGQATAGAPPDEHLMPANKKLVSRRLFAEFRWNVQRLGGDAHSAYTTLPTELDPGNSGVQSRVRTEHVDIFMLDTRSERKAPAPEGAATSSILGQSQWRQLESDIRGSDKRLIVIASGSPYSSSGWLSDQSWKQGRGHRYQPYAEFGQLRTLARELHAQGRQLLFIGGDRHTVKIIDDDPALPEIVCAGAAAPKPPRRNGRHFCMLQAHGGNKATVQLYTLGELDVSLSLPPGPEALNHPPADAWAGFYTLFLITNRRFDAHGDPTDETSDTLRYYCFDGTRHLHGKAVALRHWDPVDAASFWEAVFDCSERLRQRNAALTPQVCVFVPGNRETNESAIAQYLTVNGIAFNATGNFCLGTCIAFDWATQWDAVPSVDNYENNIERAVGAARHLHASLATAREVADRAQVQLSLVAHSLGNRVAEAALRQMPPGKIDRYYANAADLPQGFFESAANRQVVEACRSVLVPYAPNDFTLAYAANHSSRYPQPRLGRTGPATGATIAGAVHYRDITNLVPPAADLHGCLLQAPPDNLKTAFAYALLEGYWR